MSVFCAEVFLLLGGFFGTLYISYTLYRKQSFFAILRADNIPVLSFYSSPPSLPFCSFFFTSPVRDEDKIKPRPLFERFSTIPSPYGCRPETSKWEGLRSQAGGYFRVGGTYAAQSPL